MRRFLSLLLLLTACCSHEPLPSPGQWRAKHNRKRPQDMSGRVLADKRFPSWLKKNYAEWIRYGYDLEQETENR